MSKTPVNYSDEFVSFIVICLSFSNCTHKQGISLHCGCNCSFLWQAFFHDKQPHLWKDLVQIPREETDPQVHYKEMRECFLI